MTKLVVDLSEPEMAAALADCAVGEVKTFTNVSATLTAKTDTEATFEVSDLEYEGEPAEPVDDVEAAPPAPPVKPPPPKPTGAVKGSY